MQEPELNRGDLDDAAPVRSEAMPTDQHIPFHGVNEDAALRIILEGTATETGERYTGMTHPNFLETVQSIKPEAREQIEQMAPSFC